MKLATVAKGESTTLMAVDGDQAIDLSELFVRAGVINTPKSVTDVVLGGPNLENMLRQAGGVAAAKRMPVSQCHLLPPHLSQANVFCVGVNYSEHGKEAAAAGVDYVAPPAPTYFTRDARSFCGPYDDIVVRRDLTARLDWEAELGVVIGIGGRFIAPQAALDHVFGYVIINDISARDVQLGRGQWFLGKNLTRTGPVGPYVVTADEIGDPQNLIVSLRVDGQVKQSASTSTMIHSVAALIADLSQYIELRPGDLISTGTPAGIGAAQNPPQFLQAGSIVEVEISGLGRQRNVVRIIDHSPA